MAIKVGIYGMGVIGRELLRELTTGGLATAFEVKEIGDISDISDVGYLLRYDSVYGPVLNERCTIDVDNSAIIIDGKKFSYVRTNNPADMHWGDLGVEWVIDCTGTLGVSALEGHIGAGAKKVMSAYIPSGDSSKWVPYVYGVNEGQILPLLNDYSISMVAFVPVEGQICTQLVKVFYDLFGIKEGVGYVYESYMNSQPLMDSVVRTGSPTYGRAGAWNITPLYNNPLKIIGKVMPALNGKILGQAVRAPIMKGGCLNLVCELEKPLDMDQFTARLNAIYKVDKNGIMLPIDDLVVSSDATADYALVPTKAVIGSQLVAATVLYDNIRGYCRLIARGLESLAQ